jgi:hypothetical protein
VNQYGYGYGDATWDAMAAAAPTQDAIPPYLSATVGYLFDATMIGIGLAVREEHKTASTVLFVLGGLGLVATTLTIILRPR